MRVFPDRTVDEEFAQLGSYGHTGTLNDRQFSYLGSLGLTGTLSDRFGSYTSSLSQSLLSLLSTNSTQLLIHPIEEQYLFQDRAGTVPVTADGQVVGRILDVGPLGRHLTAVSDPARGVFRRSGRYRWIEFNGVNTAYSTTALPAPGVDKAQVFGAVRMTANPGGRILAELSATSDSSAGSLSVWRPSGGGGTQWYAQSRGSAGANVNQVGFPLNAIDVVSATSDISGDRLTLRVDGVQAAQSTADQGTGNFNASGAYPLFVGARNGASLFFTGDIYGALITRFSAANLSTDTISATEALLTAEITGAP